MNQFEITSARVSRGKRGGMLPAGKIDNTSMKPLISVIIPVYNAEKYLRRCYRSLLRQTFQEFEILFVDDSSTDRSVEILTRIAAEDSRVQLIRNRENLGLGPARDRGVKEARGEYILFLDADDYLTDDALETLCDAVLQDEADITVFQARHLHRFSQRIYPEFPDRINGSGRDFLPAFLMTRTPHPIFPNVENYEWNKLIRRNLIIRNEIRHLPDPLLGEDFYFTTQLLMYADKVVCLPKTLYCYERRNAGSLTARSDLRFFATCFRPIVEVRNFLQQHGAWTQELETRFYMHIYRYFYFEILNRLSFFSDQFNNELILTVASGLKKNQLWREQTELWRGFEPIYPLLAAASSQSGGKTALRKLKLLKIKVYYIPRTIVKIKKMLFRQSW